MEKAKKHYCKLIKAKNNVKETVNWGEKKQNRIATVLFVCLRCAIFIQVMSLFT
jgi:hypothetical protein